MEWEEEEEEDQVAEEKMLSNKTNIVYNVTFRLLSASSVHTSIYLLHISQGERDGCQTAKGLSISRGVG